MVSCLFNINAGLLEEDRLFGRLAGEIGRQTENHSADNNNQLLCAKKLSLESTQQPRMRQTHTDFSSQLSDVVSVAAKHPRVVGTLLLLVFVLASQGTVSAETAGVGDLVLAEPSGAHSATTGP